jgi:hypothetical protein
MDTTMINSIIVARSARKHALRTREVFGAERTSQARLTS